MAGVCVWQGVCMAGGMHGGEGGMAGGNAWHMVNEQAVRILLEYILVEGEITVNIQKI